MFQQTSCCLIESIWWADSVENVRPWANWWKIDGGKAKLQIATSPWQQMTQIAAQQRLLSEFGFRILDEKRTSAAKSRKPNGRSCLPILFGRFTLRVCRRGWVFPSAAVIPAHSHMQNAWTLASRAHKECLSSCVYYRCANLRLCIGSRSQMCEQHRTPFNSISLQNSYRMKFHFNY